MTQWLWISSANDISDEFFKRAEMTSPATMNANESIPNVPKRRTIAVMLLGQQTRCLLLVLVLSLTLLSYYLAVSRTYMTASPTPCPRLSGNRSITNSTQQFIANSGVDTYHAEGSNPAICRYFSCIIPMGRLGNQLFQYASVFGISQPHNRPMLVSESDEVYRYFELPSAAVVRDRDSVCGGYTRISERYGCCAFDPGVVSDSQQQQSYTFLRHLQSWRYFVHVKSELHMEFTFRPFIKEPATEIVENYRVAYSVKRSVPATMVGVHIRGDDINNTVHRNLGWQGAPVSYVHRAIDHFLASFENVVFIVTTNDMVAATATMDYRNITVEFVYVSPSVDLAVLSSCDHVIITVGSYGWWAGFLAKGSVVYYKYPMREGSKTRREFNYNDYFMPHWVGLE